jgi:transcriptional regulator with XRE-family HTH domain
MVDIGIALICGRVIEKLRNKKGLSQKSLADRSGLHVNTIHLIENGNNEPKLSTFFFLASSLEVTPEDLMKKITTDYDAPKRTDKVIEKNEL